MTQNKHRRLWTPALAVGGGTVIAVAIGIGQSWLGALLAEILTLCYGTALYSAAWHDTDVGAVIGRRSDERQQLILLKAARLSLLATGVAVIVACPIAAAVKVAIWPYQILAGIIAVSYLVGLRLYGIDPDEAHTAAAEYSDPPGVM